MQSQGQCPPLPNHQSKIVFFENPAQVALTTLLLYTLGIHAGGKPAAATRQVTAEEPRQVTTGEQVSKFAGRMGNIMANSMAGGFGATIGSRAAHSVWNGVTGRR